MENETVRTGRHGCDEDPTRVHHCPYRTVQRCPGQVPWHADPNSNSLTCLTRMSVTNRLCLGNVQCLGFLSIIRESGAGGPLDQRPLVSFEQGPYANRGPSRLPQLPPPLPPPICRRRVHLPRNTSIPSLWPVSARSIDHMGLQSPRVRNHHPESM